MAQKDENVKEQVTRWAWCQGKCRALLEALDRAPRLGWYVAFISTANLLVQLLS